MKRATNISSMRMAVLVAGLVASAPLSAQTAAPAAQPPGFTAPPKVEAPAAAPVTAAPAEHSEVEVKKTARTGRDLFVGSYISIDRTCKVGKQPTIEFNQQPSNGAIRKRRDSFNLSHAPGTPRNKCLGVSPEGIAVMYASKSRFKGEDSFSYTVTFADGRTRTVKATITVQ